MMWLQGVYLQDPSVNNAQRCVGRSGIRGGMIGWRLLEEREREGENAISLRPKQFRIIQTSFC